MSFSACRTYPRTTVVLAFLALSFAAQLQTVVDLHPLPAGTQVAGAPVAQPGR